MYITSGRLVTTLLIESPTIYKRMLPLAEISSIWNRANHFYRHEPFHPTFFSKRVYVRRGNSWISLSSPIKFSMFFATDGASKTPGRNIFNGWLPWCHGHYERFTVISVVLSPRFCRRRDSFAATCSYFDQLQDVMQNIQLIFYNSLISRKVCRNFT